MWGERKKKITLDAFIIITGSLPKLPRCGTARQDHPGRRIRAFAKNFSCHFSFCREPTGTRGAGPAEPPSPAPRDRTAPSEVPRCSVRCTYTE